MVPFPWMFMGRNGRHRSRNSQAIFLQEVKSVHLLKTQEKWNLSIPRRTTSSGKSQAGKSRDSIFLWLKISRLHRSRIKVAMGFLHAQVRFPLPFDI